MAIHGSVKRVALAGALAAALIAGSAAAAQAAPVPVPARAAAAVEAANAASPAVASAVSKRQINSFAKRVNAYAKKKARTAKGTSTLQWWLPVKSSKGLNWWVNFRSGKGYRLGGQTSASSLSQTAVTRYRKAVMAKLTRSGMRLVGTAKASNQVTRAYLGSRYACTVVYTTPSRYGYSPAASFWCTSRAKARAAAKRVAPFVKAYHASQGSTKNLNFGAPTIKASASASYRTYQKAHLGISPVEGYGGFSGRFGKAPGGGWTFIFGLQGAQTCDTWEATQLARRAWAGELCYRGTWPNSYEDTVQAW